MIGLLLIAVAATAMWAWKTRDAQALRFGDVAAVIAALIAFRLMTTGKVPLGMLALGGAGWWYWFRRRGGTPAMPLDRARRLLDVGPDADAVEIRAAHRRLIRRVHPDTGGSAELTSQINAARDALLARRG